MKKLVFSICCVFSGHVGAEVVSDYRISATYISREKETATVEINSVRLYVPSAAIVEPPAAGSSRVELHLTAKEFDAISAQHEIAKLIKR